ncbi:MAG: hypothetical protein LBL07_09255 [Tannerella sp.]|jgi:hypothetical protein|nr:hypothetical protein [Tannerella sp.]
MKTTDFAKIPIKVLMKTTGFAKNLARVFMKTIGFAKTFVKVLMKTVGFTKTCIRVLAKTVYLFIPYIPCSVQSPVCTGLEAGIQPCNCKNKYLC